jgi:TRIAD3 protein (E3 ubiquitin-protein ligase RNF216)
MTDVIEVGSSSPDHQKTWVAAAARHRSKPKRTWALALNADNVIELSDSDSDDSPVKPKQIAFNSKAGSSSTHNFSQHSVGRENFLFEASGSRSAEAHISNSASATSMAPSRIKNANPNALPLFLASDDEDQPVDEAEQAASPSKTRPDVTDSNVIDGYVAQVLEIVPDVHPDHVHALIIQHLPTYLEEVVQPVLHILFEDPTYPKIDRKGKRKRIEDEAGGIDRGKPKTKVDFGGKDRIGGGGPEYVDIAMVRSDSVLNVAQCMTCILVLGSTTCGLSLHS